MVGLGRSVEVTDAIAVLAGAVFLHRLYVGHIRNGTALAFRSPAGRGGHRAAPTHD